MKHAYLLLCLLISCGCAWQWVRSAQEREERSALLAGANSEHAQLKADASSLNAQLRDHKECKARSEAAQAEIVAAELNWNASVTSGIETLRRARELNQPPKRKPKLPRGELHSYIFPELLGDPEYRALARKVLEKLGPEYRVAEYKTSPELAQKLIDLLVDAELVRYDYQAALLSTGDLNVRRDFDAIKREQAVIMKEYDSLTRDLERSSPSSRDQSLPENIPSVVANQFASTCKLRLSYSDTPLSQDQTAKLSDLFNESYKAGMAALRSFNQARAQARASGKPASVDRASLQYSDAILEKAAAFLSEPQLAGLRELQAEELASKERSLLPRED